MVPICGIVSVRLDALVQTSDVVLFLLRRAKIADSRRDTVGVHVRRNAVQEFRV